MKLSYSGKIKRQLFNKTKWSPVDRKLEKWANENGGFSYLDYIRLYKIPTNRKSGLNCRLWWSLGLMILYFMSVNTTSGTLSIYRNKCKCKSSAEWKIWYSINIESEAVAAYRALRLATCMLPNAAVEQVVVGSATNPPNVRILESIFPPEKFKVRYGTLCRYVVYWTR